MTHTNALRNCFRNLPVLVIGACSALCLVTSCAEEEFSGTGTPRGRGGDPDASMAGSGNESGSSGYGGSTAGTTSGGASTGGSEQGSSGGAAGSSGMPGGGASGAGGYEGTGGTSSGGAGTGGAGTGGAGTGGAGTGGAGTGGAGTGGAGTGGTGTGGTGTGGAGTGGTGTGGSDTGGTGGTSGDTAIYNFESSSQGWTDEGGCSALAPSTTRAYAGSQSLMCTAQSTIDRVVVQVSSPSAGAGAVIYYRFWIPSGSGITSVQPFVMDKNWSWTGKWTQIGGLTGGAWNELTVTVPNNAALPLNTLGVEFMTGTWGGDVYVDSITW